VHLTVPRLYIALVAKALCFLTFLGKISQLVFLPNQIGQK